MAIRSAFPSADRTRGLRRGSRPWLAARDAAGEAAAGGCGGQAV